MFGFPQCPVLVCDHRPVMRPDHSPVIVCDHRPVMRPDHRPVMVCELFPAVLIGM